MSEFKWHMMAEEMPEKGKKDYLVMGLKGGLYLAPRFEGYGESGDEVWFRDTRGNHHYPDKVLAWAEVPKLEDRDAQESENAKLRDVESENASLRGAAQGLGELCDKYKADNAKLLKERDKYYDLYVHAIADAEVWHLQWSAEYQENAKLRELLKNALTYIEYEGCGVECPETGNSATLTPCDACNRYETESCAYVIAQSARELRVKVDG